MSTTFQLSEVDESLAERLQSIDDDWLEGRLETLAKEYHDSRKGSAELAPFDKKSDIDSAESIDEAEKKRLKLKFDRQIGGRRR
jgi:hypothetical protein